MNKKIVLLGAVLIVVIFGLWILVLNRPKSPLSDKTATLSQQLQPSETLIEYADPSGFSFSYPDNLSLTKNETADEEAYADILLSANGVNGSLNLKIADSKFKSIDEWIKANQTASQEAPKEVKLGNLNASEIRLKDRLLLGALDQGVLFTIEMPLLEEDFWLKVYHKILETFSFAPPSASVGSSSEDVTFEGEEVVE